MVSPTPLFSASSATPHPVSTSARAAQIRLDDVFAKFNVVFTKNYIRTCRSDFIQYQTWCFKNRLKSISASANIVATCAHYLSGNTKNATIRRRINSLAAVLKLSKHYGPINQPAIILTIKRMHRKLGRAHQQAAAFKELLLNQLHRNCETRFKGFKRRSSSQT